MRIPDYLAEIGKERMEGFSVEGFVFGTGPTFPKLMLVGEAPGETEINNGIPFSGRAGKKLMEFLEKIGLSREEVYITSTVRSRPYIWKEKKDRQGNVIRKKYNRPPTVGEIIAHAPLLDYELQHVHAPLIVTLGNVGLRRILGRNMKITEVHGQLINSPVLHINEENHFIQSKKVYTVFPTFHPASVFYNPKLREAIEEDQERLHKFLKQITN
ncbi:MULTISPECIES: uracil-DNA glycosylase [Bacillus]|uniref:uracil-DNA glycosylase n=1 Tax=Bacillus TaxID=1386 RepID=UPI0002D27133|nr:MULTISPECIES: uracil-DNA glycosylase [Bacillus]